MSYVVRLPHIDFAGNFKRIGEPAEYDPVLYARGLIRTPEELAAEEAEVALRRAKVTYEPHHYEKD